MNDYIHKVTSWLEEQYDEIHVEDLEVKEMVENNDSRTLRKHILHSNFSKFVSYISYKAERAGRRVVKVDPACTSKTCARCGHVKRDLSLSNRVFTCPNCCWLTDRDYNASLNILGSRLLEPVDRRPLLYTSQRACTVSFLEEAGKYREVKILLPRGRGNSLIQ